MTHSLHTRVADDGDRAAIRALYEQALRGHIETIWGWDPAGQQANFDQAYTTMATLVVEQDGAMRGYIQLNLQAPEVYLSMLVLSPDCARRASARRCCVRSCSGPTQQGAPCGCGCSRSTRRRSGFMREKAGWSNRPTTQAFSCARPRKQAPAKMSPSWRRRISFSPSQVHPE